MPIASKVTYGLCKLKGCRVRFRKKNKRQVFCCTEHKDAFHKRGQFPFDRMRDDIVRLVRAELVEPLRVRVAELERMVAQRYLLGAAGAAEAERQHTARVLNAGGGGA